MFVETVTHFILDSLLNTKHLFEIEIVVFYFKSKELLFLVN